MVLVVRRLATALALALTPGAAARAEPATASFAMRELILEGVGYNFSGDFDAADRVWGRLRGEDPTHPAGAVYEVSTLYWRHVFDDEDTRYDAAIERGAKEAIRLGRARLDEDEADAEAHYYTGQALFDLARLEGIRGRFLSAGTHGERARKHLERALELRPALVDAKCPLGMYYYYAGLLPGIVKWLRWLWFVPMGEAPTGLRYLNEVYGSGDLRRLDAALILMNIHTYHEPGEVRALALATELHERFPENGLLHYEYLEALFEAGRYPAVADAARGLEARRIGDGELDPYLGRMARAIRARAELYRGRAALAWTLLEDFGPEGPERPGWGGAWVLLTRAQALDAQGERSRAIALYERVRNLEPPRRSDRAADLAERWLAEPFVPPEPLSIRAAQ